MSGKLYCKTDKTVKSKASVRSDREKWLTSKWWSGKHRIPFVGV
jgi:hypothetical protein